MGNSVSMNIDAPLRTMPRERPPWRAVRDMPSVFSGVHHLPQLRRFMVAGCNGSCLPLGRGEDATLHEHYAKHRQ